MAAGALLYVVAMVSGLSPTRVTAGQHLTSTTAGGSLSVDLNDDRCADIIFCYRQIQSLGDSTAGEKVLEAMPIGDTALLFAGREGLLLQSGDRIAAAHLPAEEWRCSPIILMRTPAGVSRWQRSGNSADRHILPVAVTIAGQRHYSWLKIALDEQTGILTLLDNATHPLPEQACMAGQSPALRIDSTQLTMAERVK